MTTVTPDTANHTRHLHQASAGDRAGPAQPHPQRLLETASQRGGGGPEAPAHPTAHVLSRVQVPGRTGEHQDPGRLGRHPPCAHPGGVAQPADLLLGVPESTINDFPPEFNEYFNSIISMDDPRHARLRRLVSAGFTPRILARLEESVRDQARLIVDEVCERGECDFVTDVAARLPLRIVCDLMGIPASQHDFVFDQSNVILGAADDEYVPELGDLITAILTAGEALTRLMDEVADSKVGVDADDLTSVLVNAEVDGERLTRAELASFFILLVVAGNETTRNAISWGLVYLTDHPDQRRIWVEDFDGVAHSAVEEIVRIASPVHLHAPHGAVRHRAGRPADRRGRPGGHELPLRQPGRVGVRRPARLRRAARPEPPRRLRRTRPALLPRRPPGPPRDQGDVSASCSVASATSVPPASRTCWHRPSSTASSTCPPSSPPRERRLRATPRRREHRPAVPLSGTQQGLGHRGLATGRGGEPQR